MLNVERSPAITNRGSTIGNSQNFSYNIPQNMTPTPEAMNCPSCGAPVAADATSCGHCGCRLAMVACPSCFGMVFVGAKFCSHCGAAIAREEVAPANAPC